MSEDILTQSADRALVLAHLALNLGSPAAARATAHQDGVTMETVTTHTVMLGWLACEVAHAWAGHYRVPSACDVAEMVLVHDAVEAIVGDTDTLGASEADLQAKAAREARGMAKLLAQVGADSWLGTRIQQYERQDTQAARWVRYLDKVTPKLTHALNGCAVIIARGMTLEDLTAAHVAQEAKLAAMYPEFPQIRMLLYDACRLSERCYGAPLSVDEV
jgi:5'-deoxynucleotidase YfbR-like HD superfamily hydrolase